MGDIMEGVRIPLEFILWCRKVGITVEDAVSELIRHATERIKKLKLLE